MAKNARVSAGVDQAFTPRVRVGVTYAHIRGTGLLRGHNLNAPVDGVAPEPAFGNVIEVVSDASMRQHIGQHVLQLMFSPPSPNEHAALDWKRTNFGSINYTWGRMRNNSDGAFGIPATGSLDAEWGPSRRRRAASRNAFFSTTGVRNFNANLNFRCRARRRTRSGPASDDNGDLIFNDRPLGVGRNTERGSGGSICPGSSSTRSCSAGSASSCRRAS